MYYLMTIISGQSKNGWKYAIKELQNNKESDVHQRWPLRSLILPAVGSDFCVIRSGDENFLCKAASKQGKFGGKTVMHPVYASYPSSMFLMVGFCSYRVASESKFRVSRKRSCVKSAYIVRLRSINDVHLSPEK